MSTDSFFNWQDNDNRGAAITPYRIEDLNNHFKTSPTQLYNANIINESLNKTNTKKIQFKDIDFNNVAFCHSSFKDITFKNCTFEKCYLINTTFTNCQFHDCNFINCNTWKIHIDSCYMNPMNFKNVIDFNNHNYGNIAISTFHSLLKNSQKEEQPDFTESAAYYFRKWQRIYLKKRLELGQISKADYVKKRTIKFMHEKIVGYGYKFSNLIITIILFYSAFTLYNFIFFEAYTFPYSADIGENNKLLSSAYLTFRNFLAYDIAGYKTFNTFSIISSSMQGIIGLILFGIFISQLIRKIIW